MRRRLRIISEDESALQSYMHGYRLERKYIAMIIWGYDSWSFIRTKLKRPELLKLFKQYVKKEKNWRFEGDISGSKKNFVAFVNKKSDDSATEIREDYSIGFPDLGNKEKR